MFTHRHYIELARVLAETKPNEKEFHTWEGYVGAKEVWEDIRADLCTLLASDNQRFRLDLFLAATEPSSAQPAVARNTGSQSEQRQPTKPAVSSPLTRGS